MTDKKFCTKCGAELPINAQFCSSCGQVVAGTAADAKFRQNEAEFEEIMKINSSTWVSFMIGIYAIFAIIGALAGLLQAGTLASTIFNSPEFQQYIKSLGWVVTQQDVLNYITWFGYMMLASGILAAISAVLVKKRIKWMVAVACCLLAAVLCVWSILGFILGLLVCWCVIGLRECFIDEPDLVKED